MIVSVSQRKFPRVTLLEFVMVIMYQRLAYLLLSLLSVGVNNSIEIYV